MLDRMKDALDFFHTSLENWISALLEYRSTAMTSYKKKLKLHFILLYASTITVKVVHRISTIVFVSRFPSLAITINSFSLPK